jgi:hypothetical protein
MKEAVRRFRSRLEGCDSSFLLWLLVKALSELPKMLRRLSLDMVRDYRELWLDVLACAAPREVSGGNGACGGPRRGRA